MQSLILGVGLILIGRLVQLQVVEYELYSPISRQNSVRQEIINPARGLILDRNGELLVDNEPIYSITITPANFDTNNIPLLARILETPMAEVREKVQQARRYSYYRSSRIFNEVDIRTFSLLQENIWRLPGIGHSIESKRHYPTDINASHILGYLREVSEQEYEDSDVYRLGDKIGRTGVENVYEKQLRGENGVEFLRVNALGQTLGSYDAGNLDVSPQKGDDIYTTLQLDLQMLAETLMVGKVGGLVALDPNNGDILAMVSSPQYDVRKLSGRLDRDYWASVNMDSTTPLFNRVVSTRQPPGSTFKPLMALIGLKLGLITEDTEVYNPGYYYKGRQYKDLAPIGTYTVETAITQSCNTFFFWLMNKVATQSDLDTWHDMIAETGLGQINSVDLPNERSGIIPDSSYFNNAYGVNKWGIGDILNLGVGQGAVSASPLQMALLASEIANGGYWVRPHVVKAIKRQDGTIVDLPVRRSKISWMEEEHINVVKKGMRRAVVEGSGRFYANLKFVEVAGKTGTAQNPHGIDHGWYICFAPYDRPQIAIACLIENGGFGSISAAPIASLIMEQFFLGEIKRKWVMERMLNFVPKDTDEEEST